MVLAEHFLEVHARGTLVFAQQLHRGGARGGGHVLAVELVQRGDAGVGLDRDAHFLDVGGDGEGHVLLARGVVGGGAALDVDRAVLHQRNAVLRGHRQVLDFQLLAGGLFEVGDDALAQVIVETGVLAVAERVRQGARRVAHAHGDAAGGLDLGDRVIGLGQGGAGGNGQGGESDQMFLHECSSGCKRLVGVHGF